MNSLPPVKKLKVLWALDAFPESAEVQINFAKASRPFLEAFADSIQPVYVIRPAVPVLLVQDPVGVYEHTIKTATGNIRRFVKQTGLTRVNEPHFVFSEGTSNGSLVKALLETAENNEYDLIFLGTHGRKGMPRFFMGSFAEQLVLRSPIPVLVSNAKAATDRKKTPKHVLFPTEFSEASRKAFDDALRIAKGMGADLFLFHQLETMHPDVSLPLIIPPVGPYPSKELIAERRATALKWIGIAEKEGIKAKFFISEKSSDAASAIVRTAKKLPASVICMASQSNQLETLLLGSVARQVLRQAPCPVHLIHPQKEAPARKDKWFGEGKPLLA